MTELFDEASSHEEPSHEEPSHEESQLPEDTKRLDACSYRVCDNTCCNALNYLRPLRCESYCVIKVDDWIRQNHPEFGEIEVRRRVIRSIK